METDGGIERQKEDMLFTVDPSVLQALAEDVAQFSHPHEDEESVPQPKVDLALASSNVMPPPPQEDSILGKRTASEVSLPGVLPPLRRQRTSDDAGLVDRIARVVADVGMHTDMVDIPELPKAVQERVKNQMYIDTKGKVRYWNGKRLLCMHQKRPEVCVTCGGSSICIHRREKAKCKECGGSSICKHQKLKSRCKLCGGASVCVHGGIRSQCKECGGGSLCTHGRKKSLCRDCGGSAYCQHGRIRAKCKDCHGASVCEHNRQKYHCKLCGGSAICQHNKIKYQCRTCVTALQEKKRQMAAAAAVAAEEQHIVIPAPPSAPTPADDPGTSLTSSIPAGFARSFPEMDQ